MDKMGTSTEGVLSGQVAIVTGGGSGIGRATCMSLAREGAHVVIVDSNEGGIADTSAEIQSQSSKPILGLSLNVRSEGDMEDMARQTLNHFGCIDILVACAGILRPKGGSPKLMVELSVAEWNEVLDTNLKGVFLSNRAVLPAMIKRRKGSIVNVSSTSGRVGRAYDSAYCASKFGVLGLTEAMAEEVRPYNIRVQTILPDAIDTPMWEQNAPLPAPSDVLPPTRVADFIVFLLALPSDTLLVNPVIAPFRTRRRKTDANRGNI